jgi:hypothetical protein
MERSSSAEQHRSEMRGEESEREDRASRHHAVLPSCAPSLVRHKGHRLHLTTVGLCIDRASTSALGAVAYRSNELHSRAADFSRTSSESTGRDHNAYSASHKQTSLTCPSRVEEGGASYPRCLLRSWPGAARAILLTMPVRKRSGRSRNREKCSLAASMIVRRAGNNNIGYA